MENIEIILICAICVIGVALIGLTVLVFSLKKRLRRLMGVKSSKHSLEAILTDYYDYVIALDRRYEKLNGQMEEMGDALRLCVQKVGVVRYNPFEDMGGDLSYALALLDANNNGLLINTMFTRENSRTYCKPVENGGSPYSLSYEEEEAIKKALGISQKPRGTEALKSRI